MACAICVAEEQEDPSTAACGHSFCHDCITMWASKRTQPDCPLCKLPLDRLQRGDGTMQDVQGAAAGSVPDDEGPDLTCLDHPYFVGEVSRMLARASSTYDRLVRDACSWGRSSGADSAPVVAGAQQVVSTLQAYRASLVREVRFDPNALLADLYGLERTLTGLAHGRVDELEDWQPRAFEVEAYSSEEGDEDWELPSQAHRPSSGSRTNGGSRRSHGRLV